MLRLENKTGEVEKVYGMMAGLHADNGGAGVSDAAAEFAMMGISPKLHVSSSLITGTSCPSYSSDIEETTVTSLRIQRTYASCDSSLIRPDQRLSHTVLISNALPENSVSICYCWWIDPAATCNRPAVNSAVGGSSTDNDIGQGRPLSIWRWRCVSDLQPEQNVTCLVAKASWMNPPLMAQKDGHGSEYDDGGDVRVPSMMMVVMVVMVALCSDDDGDVPRVLVTCRSRQIDDDENVSLNDYINNYLRIQFGRGEFCLVTGLRFRVENREEYDTQANLPFRRRMFSSHLDGQPITGIDITNAIVGPTFAELYDDDAVGICCLGILQLVILGAENRRIVPQWLLRIANDRVAWNKYPWGSYVWPTLYSQLRNANVRRWSQFYVEETTNENDAKTYSLFGYTWAFKTWILESFRVTSIRYFYRFDRYPRVATWRKKKGRFLAEMVIPFFEGNIPAARLTPDDNEARSDWWISSKAYFDGFIDQVERVPFDISRQNMHEIPSEIYRQFVEQKD
ncbi:phospholipase-like protein [Tanacetum coccineum]